MKSTFDKLKQLRLLYEAEKASRLKKYKQELKEAKEEYERSLALDFVDEEKMRFEVSLNSLEGIYADIVDVYRRTKGLTFSITAHMARVSARPVEYGKVNEYFDRIAIECNYALDEIERSVSPEQDIPHIKSFCQGLADLRYVVKNARRLIEEAGDTKRRKDEVLRAKKAAVSAAQANLDGCLDISGFDCYDKLSEFASEIKAEQAAVADSMLANKPVKCRNDYKFLMGFYTADIPAEDLDFAQSVLNIPGSAFAVNPVYFDLNADKSTLLINAPAMFFEKSHVFFNDKKRTLEFHKLLNNIYLSFMSNLPAKFLLFSGVEPEGVGNSVLGGIEISINEKLETGMYSSIRKKVDSITDSIPELFENINDLCDDRSAIYTNKLISDIFEYNGKNPSAGDYFLMFVVNRYPFGFDGTNFNGREELVNMATQNGSKGVISVICQQTDANFSAAAPMLTAEELNADVIDVAPNGVITYNGKRVTLDVRAPGFDYDGYMDMLADYYSNASNVSLYDIIDKERAKGEEQRLAEKSGDKAFYKRLIIPMGESGGQQFDLDVKSCSTESFVLLVGNAGSGKSSFLHTLILSAAEKYSPEELQIGLIDFKAKEQSPEFSQYQKKRGEENLYLPHVNYLMVNGKAECALDLFNMLSDIIDERSKYFAQCGVSELSSYNQHERVLSKELPQFPVLLFIIDEYNVMLEGDGKRDKSINRKIITALTSTIRLCRACGIAIVLAGQSVAGSLLGEDAALTQMNTRVSLYTNSVEGYTTLMGSSNVSAREAKSDVRYLRDKGFSIFTTDAGRTRKQVRHAYAGYTGCKKQVELASFIRKKWGERDQLIAGAETRYTVGDDLFGKYTVGTVKDKIFQVPLGVASATLKPQGLRFSSAQDCFNYYAFASAAQLDSVEQNAALSFLNTAAKNGVNNEGVVYLSTLESYTGCLDEYVNGYPELSDKIELVLGSELVAQRLMSIYQTFEQRRSVYSHERKPLAPVLYIFHDVEWLTDENVSWLDAVNDQSEAAASASRQQSAAPGVTEADIEEFKRKNPKLAALPTEVLKSIINRAKQNQKSESAAQPARPSPSAKKHHSVEDVRAMFRTLYTRGNRYNMFMLVTSSTMGPINKAILDRLDAAGKETAKSFAVYGSQLEMVSNGKRDVTAKQECVFSCPSESKVRLYDFSPKNSPKWFDEFISKIK